MAVVALLAGAFLGGRLTAPSPEVAETAAIVEPVTTTVPTTVTVSATAVPTTITSVQTLTRSASAVTETSVATTTEVATTTATVAKADLPRVTSGETISLDDIPVTQKDGFSTDAVQVDGEAYSRAHLLRNGGCFGTSVNFVEYNLSRGWRTLTTLVGVTDSMATDVSIGFTIILDGKAATKGKVSLGVTVPVTLDVTDVLRMRFETRRLSGNCGGDVAFADPEMSR